MTYRCKNSLLVVLLALSLPALAKERPNFEPSNDKDWSFSLGLGALSKPEFKGAEDSEIQALPFFSVRYKDILSIDAFRGLDYYAYKQDNFSFSVGAEIDFGREEDDSDILGGLGDVDPSIQPRASFKYQQANTEFTFDYVNDLIGDGHDGQNLKFSVAYTQVLRPLILKPSIGFVYSDDTYMQSYFGVSSAQALTSEAGLPAYEANSGLSEVNAKLSAIYAFNRQWNTFGFIKYTQLQGDAKDSPLVEKDNQLSVGIALGYNF